MLGTDYLILIIGLDIFANYSKISNLFTLDDLQLQPHQHINEKENRAERTALPLKGISFSNLY